MDGVDLHTDSPLTFCVTVWIVNDKENEWVWIKIPNGKERKKKHTEKASKVNDSQMANFIYPLKSLRMENLRLNGIQTSETEKTPNRVAPSKQQEYNVMFWWKVLMFMLLAQNEARTHTNTRTPHDFDKNIECYQDFKILFCLKYPLVLNYGNEFGLDA